MAPRSTTSATAPNKPRCTAWCSSTPPPSSSRLQAAAGTDLPQFVKDEFEAFLECGILAHGFVRLRCGECGHDKLVAFSCKRRGLQAELKAEQADSGAVTLIQRFGSAANLNIRLHCLVLDGA